LHCGWIAAEATAQTFAMNDDRPELFAEIGAEAKRVLAIARRLFAPRGRIVRPKEPTLENKGRRAMRSAAEEDLRRGCHGTVLLSDNAWLSGFKQLRLGPRMHAQGEPVLRKTSYGVRPILRRSLHTPASSDPLSKSAPGRFQLELGNQ
jgi:hypothetical protein